MGMVNAVSKVMGGSVFFAVPIPAELLSQAVDGLWKRSELGVVALIQGEARFTDPLLADSFADELGDAMGAQD